MLLILVEANHLKESVRYVSWLGVCAGCDVLDGANKQNHSIIMMGLQSRRDAENPKVHLITFI